MPWGGKQPWQPCQPLQPWEPLAPALDFSGEIGGVPGGMTIAVGPENATKETPWYVIAREDNTFYYFSPALLYRQPQRLAAGETLRLEYVIKVHAGVWESRQVDELAATQTDR